jgi:hypothetical protein
LLLLFISLIETEAMASRHNVYKKLEDTREPRLEITAMDKIRILKEVEESNVQRKAEGLQLWTVEEICDR